MDMPRESICVQRDPKGIQTIKASSNFWDGTRKFKKDLWNRLLKTPSLGIILCLLSNFCFSVAFMLIKIIKGVDPLFFLMCRGILQVFLFNAVAFYQGLSVEDLKSKKILLSLFLVGLFGSVGQALAYGAVKYIPIGDATAIFLSAPVFVSFFACILLKEKCNVFHVVTIIIAVVGVLLVCRPTFIFGSVNENAISETDHVIGTSMVIVGCLFISGLYVVLRMISHIPTAITNSTSGISCFSVSLIVLIFKGNWHVPNCGLESALFVISVFAGTMAMMLFVCASKVEEAGPLSVVRTSEIIFAFIWQMGLLDQMPTWTTLTGVGAIIFSVVLMGMQKWTSKKMIVNIAKSCKCCSVPSTSTSVRTDVRPTEPLPMQVLLSNEHC